VPPLFRPQFKKIGTLGSMPVGVNTVVDVLAVVHSVSALASITKKDGSSTEKRSLMVRDDSGFTVELTLWSPMATREGEQLDQMLIRGEHPTVAISAARLSEFGGNRTLGTVTSTHLKINPDSREAQALRAWYEQGGAAAPSNMLGGGPAGAGGSGGAGRTDRFVSFQQIKDETVHGVSAPFYVCVRAYLTHLKPNAETGVLYPACPRPMDTGRACQKKLRQENDQWHCERHQGQPVDRPDWRYLISAAAVDWSGPTLWLSAFGEVGEKLFGMDGNRLRDLFAGSDFAQYEKVVNAVPQSLFNIKLKCSTETYQDQQRVKHTIMALNKVSFAEESRKLIEALKSDVAMEQPPGQINPAQVQAGTYGAPAGGYGGAGGYQQPQQQQQQQQQGAWGGGGGDNAGGYGGGGGGGGGGAAKGTCYKCGGEGHWARDCPGGGGGVTSAQYGGAPAQGGGGRGDGGQRNTCYKCGGTDGHWCVKPPARRAA